MKKWIGIALCLVPLAAHAQQRYTNEDLRKFSVPGAYTNQDLKKMAPLPVAKGAAVSIIPVQPPPPEAEALQIRFSLLSEQSLSSRPSWIGAGRWAARRTPPSTRGRTATPGPAIGARTVTPCRPSRCGLRW
jgi:hypothetical protein